MLLPVFSITLAEVEPADFRQKLSDKTWEESLRKQNFQDREIIEGAKQNIFELKAPYTAEDASVVPISIHTKIKQTKERYIKKMHIFVDKNPMPLVGIFEFTPDSGKADLAMRIRVDTFAYVRAIAELNTGELYYEQKLCSCKRCLFRSPTCWHGRFKKIIG
ncbi:MAG: thiosulfate oxidation carrier protein SoxY [Gammaproteobacteria bacterium]|jgi:sulfur-oxidizing protein SoxY